MFGRSYLGETQYMAASTKPPHLIAIIPEMCPFDLYSSFYSGGVFRGQYVTEWGRLLNYLNNEARSVPVDNDPRQTLLKMAKNEHKDNYFFPEAIQQLPFRDSTYVGCQKPYLELGPEKYLEAINESGVAVYQIGGWFDCYSRDAFLFYQNLRTPKKITVGPWSHVGNSGIDIGIEYLRWFDYWLKGIDNGIMNEAPVQYFVIGASRGNEWRSSQEWPLSKVKSTCYFFQAGSSKSIQSINDGLLTVQSPVSPIGDDSYTVDYTATSGKRSRWKNLTMGKFGYPNMASNDRKGLTYTSPPVTQDLEITGHPVVHLWISTTANDGDFFVYLEDVDKNGYSRYITEGALRVSHRVIYDPPYDRLGLPFHRSFKEDITNISSDSIVELVFDLFPVSYIYRVGHRIRVTITCSDKDNAKTPILTPPPKVKIYRNMKYQSRIVLPIISN